MRITVTAERYQAELVTWLDTATAKHTADLVNGVPADVYLRRVEYLRALRDIRAQLDEIMKKAKD